MYKFLSEDLPTAIKLVSIFASLAVYLIVFLVVGPILGETSGTLFLIPVIVVSLLCGKAIGALVTILGLPINSLMFFLIGSMYATPTIVRLIIFILALIISLMAGTISEAFKEQEKNNQQLYNQNILLQSQLKEIKQLRGLLPICMHCKSIRDEDGYWHKVEEYIADNTDIEFTHGICDSCLEQRYSGYQYTKNKPGSDPAG